MPDNRPNEDRYTNQPEFLAPRGHDPSYMDKPFTPANSHGPNGPYKESKGMLAKAEVGHQNIIQKLTAPPESFLEHAERIGLHVNVNDIMTGDGRLLRRHYSINFSEHELKEAEGR